MTAEPMTISEQIEILQSEIRSLAKKTGESAVTRRRTLKTFVKQLQTEQQAVNHAD